MPDLINPFIESECPLELGQTYVNSLRLRKDGSWDVDILHELFQERDRQVILSIPLSNKICDDCWMWADDVKGCYTFKSGYKRLISSRVPQSTAPGINWL